MMVYVTTAIDSTRDPPPQPSLGALGIGSRESQMAIR